MRRTAISRTIRFAAGVMGLLMLLIVLLSVAFLVAEAEHDCVGEDCPVCEQIRQCENILRQFGCAALALLVSALIAGAAFLVSFHFQAAVPATPVSRKVRMNN